MIALLLLLAAEPQWNCDNPMAQQEMNMCARFDFDRADAELNAAWKSVTAAMKRSDRELDRTNDKRPGHFDTLLAGQRAWLTYRDRQCELTGFEMRGGSAEPLLVNGCLARLTRERTQQLKSLIETGN